jgi:exonuclease VII large subunit
MTTFRIHHAEGTADITAKTPTAAREMFLRDNPGVIITKIKRVKE